MHPSRPSMCEAVSERGEIDGAPSPDDALHRRENHEAQANLPGHILRDAVYSPLLRMRG